MSNRLTWVHDPVASLVGPDPRRDCGLHIDCLCRRTTLQIDPPGDITPEKR